MRGRRGRRARRTLRFRRSYRSPYGGRCGGRGPCRANRKQHQAWIGSKTNEGAWRARNKNSEKFGDGERFREARKSLTVPNFISYAASVFPRTCFLIFQ